MFTHNNCVQCTAGKDCFLKLEPMINVSVDKKVIIKGEAWMLPRELSVKCKCLSIKCILVANIHILGNKSSNQIFLVIHHMYVK